jgi:DNA-directed RNA polymerase specialized sigma24 family protein
LLPYNQMRRIGEAGASRQVLDRSLRRWLGDENLFEPTGPVRDPFDHYGREVVVEELAERCEEGRVTAVAGMAQVGKTSLLWQVVDRLPGALVAWLEPSGPPTWDLYRQLRRTWLDAAGRQSLAWRQHLPDAPAGRLTAEQIQEDLEGLCAALPVQEPAVHLVAVLDNVPAKVARSEVMEALAQAAAATEGASLLYVGPHPGLEETPNLVVLKPFDNVGSAQLVRSLAIQMFLEFDAQAIERLHLLSGGHPLLLRQLAGMSITRKRGRDPVRSEDVEAATAEYLTRPDSALRDLWESLAEREQETVHAALSTALAPPREILTPLERLGWLRDGEGQWTLFSEALERWLGARHPRQ